MKWKPNEFISKTSYKWLNHFCGKNEIVLTLLSFTNFLQCINLLKGYSLFNVWEAKTKYLLNLHSSKGHRAYSHVNGTLSQPKLTISMISKEHKYFLTTRKIVKCQISSNKYRSCNNWSLTVSSEIECANILFMCNIFVLVVSSWTKQKSCDFVTREQEMISSLSTLKQNAFDIASLYLSIFIQSTPAIADTPGGGGGGDG